VSISTHVLDAANGRPAAGVGVALSRDEDGVWVMLVETTTDGDGRVPDLYAAAAAGVYRLRFDVEGYSGAECFYPEVIVTFRVTDPAAHHHVPLLLSPYAYSTYRGS
jgi:5-hydroxyisourate hydrolase